MISPVNGVPAAPSESKSGAALKPAQEFEALLIGQLLRSARESGGGSESDSIMDLAEGQFASLIAANGGLGLASLVAKSLEAPKQPSPPTRLPE